MVTFAALMIIVACHADSSACVKEPVAVISYQDSKVCREALPAELARAQRLTRLVYGDCVPVDPSLLAGRKEIRREMAADQLSAALTALRNRPEEPRALFPRSSRGGLTALMSE